MTKDAYYFPHDSNARHDPKMMALVAEFGLIGYAYFFMLIEILREQSDYSLKQSHSSALAIEWQAKPDQVSEILKQMERLDLIEITKDGMIKSCSLCRRMATWDNHRKACSDAGKKGAAKLWGRHNDAITPLKQREENKENKKSNKKLTQDEFIASLKTNPVYKHIDIDRELLKAQAWIEANPGRKLSRVFFVRWLNKIDPGMEVNKSAPKSSF